ncbi:MAG: hypothetical protein JNJ88_08305 [Planctomycetes bacterium]|nr:hypothetical protein [Planctomycetota bacterium]
MNTDICLRPALSVLLSTGALLLLAGCMGPQPRRASYDPQEHVPFERAGTASVSGRLWMYVPNGGGKIDPCAGVAVSAVPATRYWTETVERQYRDGEELDNTDPRAFASRRATHADSQGNFRIDGLPGGTYFIVALLGSTAPVEEESLPQPMMQSVSRSAWVIRRVDLPEGGTQTVELTF